MMRGFDLSWISKGDGIPWPKIVYSYDKPPFSGCYHHPDKTGLLLMPDGRILTMEKGIIEINEEEVRSIHDHASIIAHEYRHHWQFYNWGPPDATSWGEEETLDWENAVLNYFTKSYTEFDALRFEIKTLGRAIPDCWEWVYKNVLERFDKGCI